MNKKNLYKKYCTGCGLCSSMMDVELLEDEHGFLVPVDLTQSQLDFCGRVCPVNGTHFSKQKLSTWGTYQNVYSGFSKNEEVRFKSASGGVTTSIAIYLLEEKLVDGIIHVGESIDNPFKTETFISTSKREIIDKCGSRYVTSSPLNNLKKILNKGGKYAIIGRPCDIVCVNNFLSEYPEYKDIIVCTLSFFCAGSPSVRASEKLCTSLGVDLKKVKKIRYRGYGWPGRATVFTQDEEKSMDYIDSWNNILGRDIRMICKFCTDGTGESADISCGDLWYLKDNKPVFNEDKGLNVVFSRTKLGDKVIQGALEKKYIELKDYQNRLNELTYVQPNHSNRKKYLYPRILGLKLTGQSAPNYDMRKLKCFCKNESYIKNIREVLGTIKRVVNKKI